MKQKLLILCTVLLVFVSGFLHQIHAQTWTPPALTFSTLTTGTTYYVYNVGSKGYLSRGGWYLTQAVVCAQPKFDPSTVTKWTATNTSGSVWTFQYNENGSNVTGKYLFCANADPNDGSVYTDNSSNNTWNVVLTDAPTNTYSIQVVNTYGGYDASKYLGSALNPEWADFWGWGPRPASMVRYNRASGDNYTQWKFVSQADMDLYNAKVLLDKYMNYAKKRGGIDISSYITTYNAGVTADINTEAANLLTTLGRTDVTSSITNPSFETTAQAGWTNSGGFANQTNTSFCKKDGTNYTEKWGGGSFLSTGTITQTISGLANGLYGIVASGYTEGGIRSGAFFKAGTDSTEINLCDDYNVDYAIVTDGTLKIGFALSGTVGCHWVAFDNFRLHYYGAIVTPVLTLSTKSLDFLEAGTKKVAVTGLNLANSINITASANFSVTPTTLPSTAAGDSVSITYDGVATASGYVVFTSGTVKDSIQVAGSAEKTITVTPNFLSFDELNTSGTFTVTARNQTSTISIAAPSGYTVNPSTLPSNANGSTVTVTFDGLSESKGYITLTSGTTTSSIRVIGRLNSTSFTPLYSTGNLITDPNFNSLASYAGSWGLDKKSITTDTAVVYSGSRCAKITGACGSSIDYTLTGKLLANTKYRLKAMVNSDKEFFFTLNGCGIDGSTNDYQKMINTAGAWSTIDFTFTTGTLAADQNLWMNSCSGSNRATLVYLDNLELYVAPEIAINPKSLTFAGGSTKKVAVTANMLTNDISITAPAGFSVTPSTLLSTVAGDSVAITYDNSVDVSGYVVFTSGSVKDSVQVTGTALSSDATLSILSVSDGELTPAFASGTITYSVVRPAETTTIPTISATANDEAHATVVITQVSTVTGSATVLVTAQDGTTTMTYTVNFTLAAPVAPVASAATNVTKTSFSANWAASAGATGYYIDVATDNAFTAMVTGYSNRNVSNATTFSVTDLAAATTYYYRVRATNGLLSANSNTISVLSLGTGVQSLAASGIKVAVTANTVELESGNAMVSVQVVSVNGTLMTEKSINATKATIGTEGWASGIYVFTIKTQGGVVTTKLGIVK